MPRYLFTSDQRISVLDSSIQRVAKHIDSGRSLSEFTDKSDNNNATTLKAYYNLNEGTEVCKQAAESPVYAIRNFVLKFQFPNVRTQESLSDCIEDGTILAPFRSVITVLYLMAQKSSDGSSYITYDEVLFYIFCNPKVYKTINVDYKSLTVDIASGRFLGKDLSSKIDASIQWNQYGRQIGELMAVLPYASKAFKISKRTIQFSLNSAYYHQDKEYIHEILNYRFLWIPSDPSNFSLATKEYFSYMDTVHTPYNVVSIDTTTVKEESKKDEKDNVGCNIIFYGAPGTGKSHTVDSDYVRGNKYYRVTFHPDTDYSSFVGCYKPTMCPVDGKLGEDEITYGFVPQVFLNSYIYAWNHPEEKTFLVIEELNRGNCAQIFGDVFQLLDRRVDDYPGFSKYKINADTDIAKYLKKHITNKDGSYENKIKDIYGLDEFDFSVMAIPDNLYILATMNTSDQSLFPIDSAFKRRWEWEYIDVNYGDAAQFKLKVDNGHIYNWSQLLFGLNSYIKSETHNTNKILGNRFVQAGADKTISAKSFRDKVLFFLFNDVFKDDDDFKTAFFGENADDKFFEDLCVSNDTKLTIKFIENVCGAKNIVPAETPAEETTETATE